MRVVPRVGWRGDYPTGPGRIRSQAAAHDDFFGLPLWLQTPCCGDVLWAYNAAHLEALEGYVSATLRTRRQDPDRGWANRSWTSRLPVWMKRARNRAAVAAGLKRLRLRRPPPP